MATGYKIQSAPSVEPVSSTEAKLHLKIDSDTTDDNLIAYLIQAAREQVESYTNRALISQTWDLSLDEFPDNTTSDGYDIVLSKSPVASITSITYKDTDGASQTLASSVYGLDTYNEPNHIYLKYGQSWPSTYDETGAITIRFTAGYGATGSTVPASIRAAMMLIIGHLYEHREDVVVGVPAMELPKGAERLLNPYRIFRF